MNKEIIKIIESRNQLAQQACEEYAPLVDTIIVSQTKDVNYISYTMDFMLDFCFDHQMLQLYRKLCRYLYDIDIETTAYYINAYREMWDEEGKMFGDFNEMLPKL
jgi:hypothetical protein